MSANANIQFGRKIKPVQIKDVYKAGVSILFDTQSQSTFSSRITVGAEPWVIKVFGLQAGESIAVCNAFDAYEEQLYIDGEAVVLTNTNNTVFLPITGIYTLIADAVFGSLVCIAYPISALDEKTRKSVDITNPNGPQQNRPNVYFDGGTEEYSQEFTIGARPWVFRAYGLVDQEIRLQNVFNDLAEDVIEAGETVKLDNENTSLLVHITGTYRFHALDNMAGVIVIGNPAVVNETGSSLMRGAKGDTGPAGSGGTVFTQASPSAMWVINHNLGYKPSVELFTVGGAEFDGNVIHTDLNQTIVYLTAPMAGTARLT